MRRELRSHQDEAFRGVAAVMGTHDRAKAVMACGSGKTLLGMRSAEEANRIVIFEPSLALIRQTLDEARVDGLLAGRAVVCVCSDKSIATEDHWRVSDEELGVPVTTDSGTLRTLLQDAGPRCIVFSTYHSQTLLRDSLPPGFRFDFGIFDEAHRTAGVHGRQFSVGLSDSQIPIAKRLFLTATPRFFPEGDKADAALAYSMDDESVYGPLAYELTLRSAIDRAIVCDYQVLTACVSGAEVQDAVKRANELFLPQRQLPVELVAGQIAIVRAIQATGARRVITFHATIEDASAFAKDRLKLYRQAGISAFHINGNMPGRQRQAVIDGFLTVDGPAILTNCHCLTEGVDVPEIDMVGILCRKESVQELVQAIGRALRNRPGKERGYVMLPLYADDNESMESALDRSDMAVTWEILHSILEDDGAITEKLIPASGRRTEEDQAQSSHRGRGHHRAVAPAALLDDLQRAISVRHMNRLGARWEAAFAAAKCFRTREGHLFVPPDHVEDGILLGRWITGQRQLRKRGRLAPPRIEALSALGMEWRGDNATWLTGLRLAQKYYAQHGNLDVPPTEALIKEWLDSAKKHAINGGFPEAKRDAIRALGIELPLPRTVEEKLAALEQWRAANPVGRPSKRGPDRALAFFLSYIAFEKNGPPDHRILDRLANIDMDVRSFKKKGLTGHQKFGDKSWDLHYQALKDYVTSNGWTGLWACRQHQGLPIASWVVHQRHERRKGKLSAERIAALDALGIHWNRKTEWWRPWVEQLEAFYREHGHLRIPSTGELALLARKHEQFRRELSRGVACEELVKRLDAIQFPRTSDEVMWQWAIAGLKRWKVANPDVVMAAGTLPNDLRNFVYRQSSLYRRGLLPASRLEALREIGVVWPRLDKQRQEMMDRLKRLAKEVGKANVEVMAYRDSDLAQWLDEQLGAAAAGTLANNEWLALRSVGIDVSEPPPPSDPGGSRYDAGVPSN